MTNRILPADQSACESSSCENFPNERSQPIAKICLFNKGMSHELLRLLEKFHKLKAVASKQLTFATNPSEKFLVSVGFRFYFCGYLRSTLERVYSQRAKHTVTTAHLKNCFFQRRTEGFYHSDTSDSCLTSSLCPTHSPKGETIPTLTLLTSFHPPRIYSF